MHGEGWGWSRRPWRAWVTRLDALLTRERLTVYPVVVLVLFVALWAVRVVREPGALLPDFWARWTGGRMLLEGRAAELYDLGVQGDLQAGAGAPALSWFVSPPPAALLFAPFGALPYAVAAGLWIASTLAGLAVVVRLAARWWPSGVSGLGGAVLVALASQPTLELLGSGQDTWIVLLVGVAGVTLLQRGGRWDHVLAGVILGVGILKPHLMVLALVILMLRRCWLALLSLVLSAGGWAVLSVIAMGPGIWLRWLEALSSPTYVHEVGLGQVHKSVSLQAFVTTLVPSALRGEAAILGLIGGVALAVAIATYAVTSRPRLHDLAVVVSIGTLLVVPHAMIYDAVLALPGCVALAVTRSGPAIRVLLAVGFVVTWLAPSLSVLREARWPFSILAAPWVTVVLLALLVTMLRSGAGRGEHH